MSPWRTQETRKKNGGVYPSLAAMKKRRRRGAEAVMLGN
jgi:hypothetical protein